MRLDALTFPQNGSPYLKDRLTPILLAEATRLLLNTHEAYPVQVGLVNDKVFLVNASLGLYPKP